MSGNIITVENLHKRFGSLHVLKGVTEHIEKGEVVSIIGPSGGGNRSNGGGSGRSGGMGGAR